MVEESKHAFSPEMQDAFKNQLKVWQGLGVQSLRRMFKAAGGPDVERAVFVDVATKFGLDGEAVVDQYEGTVSSEAFLVGLREPFPDAS